ncbi:MAG: amino acid permease [Rhodospirillaceae bacterium]|jgi:amino acid transporter|nr:amino acid permease [Rhodospirillaceae bacterium]MBT6405751.1 amino acid permease [Rhodospirillaceae bacterium]MBT6534638.1 amino acid permease [Rhodospirillaceae bacterium]MBT7361721.1 amino acid permease [Rhodospirillaceae bacterium]
MKNPKNEVSFWSAVAMGIGAMVGAGIFALLGQAGAVAGSAVFISFLIAGGIALLSGYSMGRLGARYPAAGGIVEYLVRGFGSGRFSGAMSLMLYIAALVALSLVARTFGSYADALLPSGAPKFMVEIFSGGIVALFMAVNLAGARSMTRIENIIVVAKLSVLVVFAVVGMTFITPDRLAPSAYPPVASILSTVAITFFAYEGFRYITNAAADMRDPARTLPRAIITSIILVMIVYVGIAIVVFGNLPPEKVIAAKDFALAEAARPVFGTIGFTVISITALFATASAINAGLYAIANVSYQLAKEGELPEVFARAVGNNHEGLVISALIAAALAIFLDLSAIAIIGALSMLIIHMTVHVGHLRILNETGASRTLVLLAIVANGVAIALGAYHLGITSPYLLLGVGGIVAISFLSESVLHRVSGRSVKANTADQ